MMLSEKERRRAVLILGAGASTEFLIRELSTETLTSLFRDNITSLIEYLRNYYPGEKLFYVKEFILDIIGSLRKYYSTSFNFEHVIHSIDVIADVSIEKHGEIKFGKRGIYSNIQLPLIDYFRGNINSMFSEIVYSLPIHVRNFLLDDICNHHAPNFIMNSSNPVSWNEGQLWKDFIRGFKNKDFLVSIHSLNYDSLMWEIIIDLNKDGVNIQSGFDLQIAGNQCSNFNVKNFYAAEDIFSPLHGSINFVPNTQDKGGVDFCRNSGDASKKRKGRAVSNPRTSDGRTDYNQAMITGLSKFDYMAKEPFATYYRRLIRDMDEASHIILIGYGGGDAHLNMLLSSSLMDGKMFYVIDCKPDLVDERFENYLQDEFWHYQNFLPEKCFADAKDKVIQEIFSLCNCKICLQGTKHCLERFWKDMF